MSKAKSKTTATNRIGPWVLKIEGVGPHHNGQPGDADAVLRDLARALEAAGHALSSASVHVGFGK